MDALVPLLITPSSFGHGGACAGMLEGARQEAMSAAAAADGGLCRPRAAPLSLSPYLVSGGRLVALATRGRLPLREQGLALGMYWAQEAECGAKRDSRREGVRKVGFRVTRSEVGESKGGLGESFSIGSPGVSFIKI